MSYSAYLPSSGFGCDVKILSALQSLSDTITNKEDITDIIIGCGINDANSISSVAQGMLDFNTYVVSNYPNAMVKLGFISFVTMTSIRDTIPSIIMTYKKCCEYASRFNYIENSHNINHRDDYVLSDQIHPTVDGAKLIARGMSSYIQCGSVMYEDPEIRTIQVTHSGINNTDFSIQEYDCGESINLIINNCTLQTPSVTFSGSYLEIGTFSPKLLGGNSNSKCIFDACIKVAINNNWVTTMANLMVKEGKLYIYVYEFSKVDILWIPQINVQISKLYC